MICIRIVLHNLKSHPGFPIASTNAYNITSTENNRLLVVVLCVFVFIFVKVILVVIFVVATIYVHVHVHVYITVAVAVAVTVAIVAVVIAAFGGEDGYQVWILPHDVRSSLRVDLNHDLGETANILGDRPAMNATIILLTVTRLIPPLRQVGPTQYDGELLGFQRLLLLLLLAVLREGDRS